MTDFPDTPAEDIPRSFHPLSFPALATLSVGLRLGGPSLHLTTLLHSISSAPALISVIIGSDEWPDPEFPFPNPWVEMDKWLARMAEHTRDKGGLRVTLRRWQEGQSVWKGFLHRFIEAGGDLTVYDPHEGWY